MRGTTLHYTQFVPNADLFFAFPARNAGGVRDLSSLRLPSELQRLLH